MSSPPPEDSPRQHRAKIRRAERTRKRTQRTASEATTERLELSPRPITPEHLIIKDEAFPKQESGDVVESSLFDEELPDRPSTDEGVESSDDNASSEDEDMSDLTFDGKPNTLDDILTHCRCVILSQPKKFATNEARCGLLASKFRGKALTWLTKKLKDTPKLFTDFAQFAEALQKDFEASDDTKKLAADKKLKTLQQKGSAQAFCIEYDYLTGILQWSDQAKQDGLKTRLKPEVRKQLIGDNSSTYEALRKVAIEYDEELYALRNPRQRRAKGKGKGTDAPDKGARKN